MEKLSMFLFCDDVVRNNNIFSLNSFRFAEKENSKKFQKSLDFQSESGIISP